jgi:antitoxin CptB
VVCLTSLRGAKRRSNPHLLFHRLLRFARNETRTVDSVFEPQTHIPVKLHIQLLTFADPKAISTRPARPGFWRSKWKWDMTGSTRSSGGLDDRRKRLLFRCWHRGTREMDLILGRFADAEIAGLTDVELGLLEQLIEVPEPDLYAALTGNVPLAPEYASALFDRIKAFRPTDYGA